MRTYPDTIRFYERVVGAALATVEPTLGSGFGDPAPQLGRVDARALEARQAQWSPYHARDPVAPGNFDWPRELARLRSNPARFDVAIWRGDMLCGLAAGRPTPARTAVGVTLIEAAPAPRSPLRGHVATIAVTVAAAYAAALGARELRLMLPDPVVFARLYAGLGFVMARRPGATPYCWREVP